MQGETDPNPGLPTPNSQQGSEPGGYLAFHDREKARMLPETLLVTVTDAEKGDTEGDMLDTSASTLSPPATVTPIDSSCLDQCQSTPAVQSPGKYAEVSKTLYAAFPSQHDREILSGAIGATAGLFHQIMWVCVLYLTLNPSCGLGRDVVTLG